MPDDISSPRVTVLMSVHNGERYLQDAVDSILRQTWKDFEFLVVNDGSTDGSADILDACNDARMRIIHLDWSGGAHALNHGLELARGEYVANLDQDDMSYPLRLQAQVTFLDRYPDVAVVGTACESLDEDSQTTALRVLVTEDREIRKMLLRANPLVHTSAMYRRQPIREFGGFNPRLKLMFDYDLWSRVAVEHKLANLPDVLTVKRLHSGQFYRHQIGFRDRIATSARIRWQTWRRHSRKLCDLRFVLTPLITLILRELRECITSRHKVR